LPFVLQILVDGGADERVEIMSEEGVSEADLSGRLATVLEEIRDVMEKRKQRIEELRQEITNIENDNEELEKTISELLDSFG
jgi:predicted  nucleic acid-binding Zn-ribbon protein